MISFRIYKGRDWNVEVSDSDVLKDGWWKLSELYTEPGRMKIDWNIINNEEIFLGFLHYITGLEFMKKEEDFYIEKEGEE